ncbi:hypothetical protein K3495_g8189 [Podosphaera aphanis]|nr:hypothetical protein K3495_g8189 [Podosphaera aphanis]
MISTSARSLGKNVLLSSHKTPYNALQSIRKVQHPNIACRVENASQTVHLFYSARKHYATTTSKTKTQAKTKAKASPKSSSKAAAGLKKKKKVGTTKSSSPKTKKVLKKKKVIAKKTVKKVRKVIKKKLTPEQKAALQLKKVRQLVLSPPNTLPRSARTVFFAQQMTGQGPNIKIILSEIGSRWSNMSIEEKEHYQKICESNKAINEKKYQEWVLRYTPDQIRIANNARKLLNKRSKRRVYSLLPDNRRPKRPLTNFFCYMQERMNSDDMKGHNSTDAVKLIAEEFKSLSPTQRKKFDDMARVHKERYIEECKNTFSPE